MSDIIVTALGLDRFGVEVCEGPVKTSHEVEVPSDLLDDLALADVNPAQIVHETFAFLLEREPASAILGNFPLDEIPRYFPEFYDELKTRLAA